MDPLRPFDAVIFDFSGVIVASAFDAIADLVEGPLDREAALEMMVGPYDRDTDHPWHQVERGELAITEWIAHVDAEARERGATIDWLRMREMLGVLGVHEVIVDCIHRLRTEGYAIALLTNNVKEGAESWRRLVPVDELFDVVVDSSEVGMRKPNPQIYLHTLELLGGVTAERAVFLDDHPGNIAGARKVGLHTVLVQDPSDAVRELLDLLAARS